jgi:hypothetical protein
MSDELSRRFKAVESSREFQKIRSGQLRRLLAIAPTREDASRAFLSAVGGAIETIVSFGEQGTWGAVQVTVHRRVSSYLRRERPLLPAETDGRGAVGARLTRFGALEEGGARSLAQTSSAEALFALCRAAQKVRAHLQRFARTSPSEAHLIEEALVRGRHRPALAIELGITPGALRQRLCEAKQHFLDFLRVERYEPE